MFPRASIYQVAYELMSDGQIMQVNNLNILNNLKKTTSY